MITGIVIAVLLLGILLLLLEILFVPGTTIVGVGGIILLAIGIYLAYDYLGTNAGHIALASSVVVIFLSLLILLKGQTWKKMALDASVQGKSVDQVENIISVGDKGKAIGRLNPIGKALFGEHIVEVTTSGDFADADQDVEVVKVEQNKIRVKII
jgi:membrane-bound ClpP family serine protease